MQLSLRRRLLLGMIGLGTLPLAAVLVLLALQAMAAGAARGPRGALDEIAASGGRLIAAVDTAAMDEAGRAALHEHVEVIAERTSLARRAEALTRYMAGAAGVTVLAVAAIVVLTSIALTRRWSSMVSAPIEELLDWVRHIERGQPLPPGGARGGAPEFAELRTAVQDMSRALDDARRKDLERERLSAFRETARRVAHEMRGPLTSAKLAIRKLRGDDEAVKVLREETERLERMASEFSAFGRLPEGPDAEIDVAELLNAVVGTTVPSGTPVKLELSDSVCVRGHYEPLRRAVQNLIRNALEAGGVSEIQLSARPLGSQVRITIADNGLGIPPDLAERVFEPYFTTKKGGTGLGLALAKQTVVAHGGTIEIQQSPGGGAAFLVDLPRAT